MTDSERAVISKFMSTSMIIGIFNLGMITRIPEYEYEYQVELMTMC